MIGIMSVMSSMIGKMEDTIESHKPIVYILNEADSFQSYIQSQDLDYEIKVRTSNDDMKDVKNKILSGEADLLIESAVTIIVILSGSLYSILPSLQEYMSP